MSLILIGLFVVAFVVLSGAIWAVILTRREFQYVIDTNSLPADHQSIHDRNNLFKWLQTGAFLAAAATFILWFHRAYSNLPRIGISRLRWGSAWAVGAWFVPFLNLVRPAALANDIWLGSDPDLPYESPLPSGRMTWLLWSWWLAFVVSFYGSRTCNALTHVVDSLQAQRAFQTGVIAFDVVGLAATVLGIVVVYKIWQREEIRSATRADTGAPQRSHRWQEAPEASSSPSAPGSRQAS